MAQLIPAPITLKGYAIYNTKTGLWSKGGTGPSWKKNAKIWSAMNHLKNHLVMFVHAQYPSKYSNNGLTNSRFFISNVYKDCIVVDVTTGQALEGFDIYDYMRDYVKRQQEKSKYYAAYDVYEEP